jgi:Secretion system C-terminal sorting domain
MKHAYTVLLSAALPILAQGQTLLGGSVTPVPGETGTVLTGAYLTPGPSGTGNTWDYSSFVQSAATPQVMVAVNTTPYGANYPTATVAQDAGGGAFGYYRGTADVFEAVGVQNAFFNLDCPTGLTVVQYPMSVGTSVTDVFSCPGVTFGEPFTRSGTITIEADGSGDLILPTGTVSNVLRLHWHQEYEDLGPNVSQVGTVDLYKHYKPGVHFAILSLNSTVAGITQETAELLDITNIGMEEAMRNTLGVDVYPNPTEDVMVVTWSVADGSAMTIELIDVSGQVVLREGYTGLTPGIQRDQMDVSTLAAGLYTLRVSDDQGNMGTKRVVVR